MIRCDSRQRRQRKNDCQSGFVFLKAKPALVYINTSVSINISKGKWLKHKSYWLSISLVHTSYVPHNIISNNCLFLQNNRLFPKNLLHHNSSLIYHAPFWRLNLYTLILIVNSKHFFKCQTLIQGLEIKICSPPYSCHQDLTYQKRNQNPTNGDICD